MPIASELAAAPDTGSHALSFAPPPARKIAKVLLLDAYSTRSLACARSWGRNGVAFAVGGESRWDMSLLSRYAREKFVYTSPKRDLAKFIADINGYARKFSADGIFPTSEAAILACNQYRHQLACTPVIPAEREIEVMFSKAKTLELAKSLGLRAPQTIHITPENVRDLDSIPLRFPAVVKSESSETLGSDRTATSRKTAYVFNPQELQSECRSRLAQGQSVLLQEWIDGYGVGVSGLFSDGLPVAVIGHRRIRESNPCGGPSALAETIELSAELLQPALALMRAAGVNGPAMVEYKVDRRTGQPYLMEINGRFWGSVLLASAAGLELPYLYWKKLNGIEIRPEETHYRTGVRGRYIVGDTKCLWLCLKGKPPDWPGEIAGRWDSLKSYFGSFLDRRTTELILTSDDPVPFLGRLMQPNS